MRTLLVGLLFLVCSAMYIAPLYTNAGTKAEERIVNLPQDSEKWYISVVGEGAQYQKLLSWFEEGNLKTLKDQVHFCVVPTTDPIYRERYKPNIKGLPTVRVQDSVGNCIYEAAGRKIPRTSTGLYLAISDAATAEELLPWRRKNKQVEPSPEPSPEPKSVPFFDPEPAPLSDGGKPVIDPLVPWSIIALCALAIFAGSIWGQVRSSKEYHKGDK